jgi:RimJ/RimL family protein N-acetyltransferase
MEPLLTDVPERIETPRLVLRVPRAGDGATILAAVLASLAELKVWMPWATDAYGLTDSESWCRRSAARFLAREELSYAMFVEGGEHVGNVSLFNIKWDVPRCEVGYWLATRHCGRGLMAEAVGALSALAWQTLKAERVEIRCDDRNGRSCRVADRCGFQVEGTLRRDSRGTDGALRDTRVYARLRPESA